MVILPATLLKSSKCSYAAGADINARDARGMTPLILAAACGRPARVQALLHSGPHVHLYDEQGKTALDHAQSHPEVNQREEITRLLVEAGIY